MKKRILSLFLAASIMLCGMPMSVSAATVNKSMTNSITDVKTKITLTGTRYFTYNFNGMQVDSRNVGAKWNVMAFENMNESDRKKVAHWYLPGSDRTEQFGEAGVQEIVDYINDKSGWSHAWKVMRDRIGNKYLSELRPFFGGNEADGDKDSFYDDEIVRLTSYNEGTAAYRVFNEYGSYKESEEIIALNASIPEMMEVGKTAYNTCVNAYYQSISAGTKALSTYTLNLIVDNCIVPGTFMNPSATMAGVKSGMDSILMSTRNLIRDSICKITDKSYSFMDETAREAIAGGSGASPEDAAKIVKKQLEIIDENYKLAKYCHNQSVLFRNTIDSKAQDVIEQIEANALKRENYEKSKNEKSYQETQHINQISDGVSRSGDYYNRIKSKEPTADPYKESELYQKQLDAYYKEIQDCCDAYKKEYGEWQDDVSESMANIVKSMGYDVVIGGTLPNAEIENGTRYFDLDSDKRRPYTPEWLDFYWQNENMENFDSRYFNGSSVDFSDESMQAIETETAEALQRYREAKTKRDSLLSNVNSIYSSHKSQYVNLCAKAKGINDACGYDAVGYNSSILLIEKRIEDMLNYYKDGYNDYQAREDGIGKDYFDVKINMINDNIRLLRNLRAEYKKNLQKSLNDYLLIQSVDDTIRSEFNKVVSERNEILDSVPDYVEKQNLNNYKYSLVSYIDPDSYTLNTKNQALNDIIDEATSDIDWDADDYYDKYNKEKAKVLKREADKLEPICEKIRTIDRKMDNLNGVSSALNLISKTSFRYKNDLYEENLERLGIDHSQMHYGTSENFDESWHCEKYDREKRAMKLLLSDFRGTGDLNFQFMGKYNDYKAVRSTSLRAFAGGAMAFDDFKHSLYGPLDNAYFKFIGSSSVPTYAGSYINIGTENELNLKALYEDEDSEVQQTIKMAENYTPVEEIVSDSSDEISLEEGGEISLDVTVTPKNATFAKIQWESLTPDIAVVDENGNVTALSEGTAIIRAVSEDAPLTEIKDGNGNVSGYEVPDEFVKEFTVNVSSEYSYGSVGDDGYLWANFGTDGKPKYTKSETKDGKTTVFARFNSESEPATVIMAIYDKNNKLIAVSVTDNFDDIRDISVSFNKNKNADHVKIMTWYGTGNMKPYASTVINEQI